MEYRSNDTGTGQQKYSEKNLSPRRSVHHRLRHKLTSNPGLRGDRSATHCVSHRPLFCVKREKAGSSQEFVPIHQTTRRHNPQDGELKLQISGYTLTCINEGCWRQSRVQFSDGITNVCIWRRQERGVTSLTWSGSTPCLLSTSQKRRQRIKH
jgi:hypothetical protein